jgi:purine-binding chemotaxis protein CheW
MEVRVQIGGEHYALPVEDVLEVVPLGQLTPVPGAVEPFMGVQNLRGEVLPVIDLAGLLGVASDSDPQRIVVAQSGALRAGFAVTTVAGVSELPAPATPADHPALAGAALVDGNLVGMVDVPAALASLAGAGAP